MIKQQESEQQFISLEGIDFTWKTPFAEWIKRDLKSEGIEVVVTRDPPYYISPWCELIEYFERGEQISQMSEAFLLLTARLDNYERFILPFLQNGLIVIADRYVDSWLAYQSIRLANYFGSSNEALHFLTTMQDMLVKMRLLKIPDLTLWISDDPEVTIQRAITEEKISKYENLTMQKLVNEQYQLLWKIYPERIKKVDALGLSIHETYPIVIQMVRNHLRCKD